MEIIATVRGENIVIPVSAIIKHNPSQPEDIKFAIKTYEADLFAFFGETPKGVPEPKFPRNIETGEIDYDSVFLIPEQTHFLLSLISQTDELKEFRGEIFIQVNEVRDGINAMKESMLHDMFSRGTLQVDFVDDGYFDHFMTIYEYIEDVDPTHTVDEIWDGLGLMGYTDNLHRSHVEDPEGGPLFSEALLARAILVFAKEKNKNI